MAQASSTTRAISTSQFVNGLGVVTHESYYNTAYNDEASGIADLQYLGIDHVRDALPNPNNSDYWVSYEQAMAAGIKFDFVIPSNDTNIAADIAVLDALEKAHPDGIDAVEGLNEVAPSQIADATAFQGKLYAAIHADPNLQGVLVFNFTLLSTNAADYAAEGNVSAFSDFGNVHEYSATMPPIQFDSWFGKVADQGMPNAPFVVTETGYDTMPSAYGGVNDDVQAKYLLNDLFDLAKEGASQTYIYELLDEISDPNNTDVQQHYGLFNNDGTPKEAATTLHNLTTILADTASNVASFTPGTLTYTVTGLNSTNNSAQFQQDYYYGILQSIGNSMGVYGNSLLMEKSDGAFDLAVWNEPDLWNAATASEITAAATPATITLGNTAEAVKVFDPLVGTSPVATYNNVTSVTLNITDHPLILEVDPATTITAMTVSLAAGTTLTTGQTARFTLTASEALQVYGTPKLTLSDGGTAAYDAAASSGNIITFDYTVLAGQSTPDLLLTGASLGNGQIIDATGNALGAAFFASMPGSNTGIVVATSPTAGTLTLDIAEDAYRGDAQFTVRVDGIQAGGTLTASALHARGDSNVFTLTGTWVATTTHQVQVAFLNDAYDGTASTDRNLYISSIAFNGTTEAATATTLYTNGPKTFTVGGSTASATAPADTLSLHLAEDAYDGNAQFVLLVDGKAVSTAQAVTALHSAGAWQDLTFAGNFGAGSHTIGVEFTNDAYGGTASTDRNLYVNGIDLNGQHYGSGVTALMSNGTTNFTVTATH